MHYLYKLFISRKKVEAAVVFYKIVVDTNTDVVLLDRYSHECRN